jgi:hypothetical protein
VLDTVTSESILTGGAPPPSDLNTLSHAEKDTLIAALFVRLKCPGHGVDTSVDGGLNPCKSGDQAI